MNNQSDNKDLIAVTSFGTQFGVSLSLLVLGLLSGGDPVGDYIGYSILAASMGGSSLGYWLWRKGYKQLSISISTGGLVVGGIISHIVLKTIGGPTGILLLASVITAGGLGGKREAAITSVIIMIWLVLGFLLIPHQPVVAPELLYLTFVGLSVPCWGAYVVALDLYNQSAHEKTETSLAELQNAHETLRMQQIELEQAHVQQNKVIEIGLLAMSDASTEDLLQFIFRSLQADDPQVICGLLVNGDYPAIHFCEAVPSHIELDLNYWPANEVSRLSNNEELDPSIRSALNDETPLQGHSFPIRSTEFRGLLIILRKQSSPFTAQYTNFLTELGQTVQVRYMREAVLNERAKLAAHIQQEERLDSLVRMAGEIAHDFNNTLMVISGTADIFEHHTLFPNELKRQLTRMQNATQISADLTNKLLTFCKGVNSPRVLVDPFLTIENFLPILEFTVADKIRIELQMPQSENKLIKTTSGQLEQILLNLVTNAKEAIRTDGLIEIILSYVSKDKHPTATHLQLVVRDNGIGISEEEINRVFEPFYSKKSPYLGGGLGLPIVHGIVSQCKGSLDLESVIGEGTTVTILLPLHTESPSSPGPETQPSGEHILLVDDEPNVRYAVAMQLDMLGYDVQQAETLEEARARLEQERPLMLITDIRLRKSSGYQVVKEARRHYKELPVLLITGFSGVSEEQHSNNDEVLIKPFSSAELREKIETVLAQTSSTPE